MPAPSDVPLSLPALTPSSTRMENSTWMRPWMWPGTWRNSYAALWTVWTPASPRLLVSSPLPEARSRECLFEPCTSLWKRAGFVFIVMLFLYRCAY